MRPTRILAGRQPLAFTVVTASSGFTVRFAANPAAMTTIIVSPTAREIASMVKISALTRSAAGSVLVADGARIAVPVAVVDDVVDATGAGDLYASGFMHGLVNGAGLRRCAELGGIAAGEIISHIGARPQVALTSLI